MKHKLISIALIAVLLCMVLGNGIGCDGDGGTTQYTLTMSSTAGGSVTPAVGAHTYNATQVVNLTATPDGGYQFVNWTGGGTDIANATAATTTITMNADHTVTAHFALGTLIENVPDTSWPSTNGTPNFCAPLAMVNILGYWDEVIGLANAQNVTAWLQPSNLNKVADYVGWFMDTNNAGSPARGNGADGHAGTYSKDITPGNVDYVLWNATNPLGTPPPVLPAGKVGHVWTGVDDHCLLPFPVGFPLIKTEIDAGRPLVVCYTHWNLNFGTNVTDPQTGEVISVYTWGAWSPNSTYPPEQWNDGYGESGIGHAVTCVGYILNWDPDGSGGLPSGNWTIVHDTWATTPKNVAVPWPGAHHPWNSSHAVLP
jgi:hypothetical protein